MGGNKKNKRKVLSADGETWVSQRRRNEKSLDPQDKAALEAFKQGLYAAKEGGGKSGVQQRTNGPQHRPVREGDPPPGPPEMSPNSKWCTVTWRKQLYWIDTSKGGWACPNCHMPCNHNHRWYCVLCGKKWESAATKPSPASADQSKPSDKDSEEESSASSDGSSDESSESEAENKDTAAKKCAADQGPCPNLRAMIEAQVTPTVTIATEGTLNTSSPKYALETAQAEADGADALLQMAQNMPKPSKAVLESLGADAELKKKALTLAKEKAEKADLPATPATALLRLEAAQEKVTAMEKDHEAWRLKAFAKKAEMEKKFANEEQQLRERATLLFLEADKRREAARVNVNQWDDVNITINNRWKAKIATQKDHIAALTAAAPVTVLPAVPAAPAPPAAAVPPPVLQPLVTLPTIPLPESMEEIVHMAAVLTGLHQLEEQDLDVRAAHPVCWSMIWEAGLDGEELARLLPKECALETRPDPSTTIPQRTLGALRRVLDKQAALWEVKHAELNMQAEVTAGAQTLFASVMSEAKRIQHRKRLPSAELTPDSISKDAESI